MLNTTNIYKFYFKIHFKKLKSKWSVIVLIFLQNPPSQQPSNLYHDSPICHPFPATLSSLLFFKYSRHTFAWGILTCQFSLKCPSAGTHTGSYFSVSSLPSNVIFSVSNSRIVLFKIKIAIPTFPTSSLFPLL